LMVKVSEEPLMKARISPSVDNRFLTCQRVFITDDLGTDYLPHWLRFLDVVVDGKPIGSNARWHELTILGTLL